MKASIKNSVFFFLTAMSTLCFGQIQTRLVKPVDTDPNYSPGDLRHAVTRNIENPKDTLFLFLGGTFSNSESHYVHLMQQASRLGFYTINLNYPNDLSTVGFAYDPDSLAFDRYRQELCFGTPASDSLSVDTLNSIYARTLNLLKYLAQNYPAENWDQYLASPTSIDWSKIIVGGHSQGAGHAAYLAKQYTVERVLMFSGPNDYSNTYQNAANWIREDGETPVENHFTYLHLFDEVIDFAEQMVNISGLGLPADTDTTLIDNNSPPYDGSRCLFTIQEPIWQTLYHNMTAFPSVVSSLNENVWEYLLTSEILTNVESHKRGYALSVYPNPSTTILHLRIADKELPVLYSVYNLAGQPVLSGRSDQFSIDISGLAKGMYFLNIGNTFTRIIKQ